MPALGGRAGEFAQDQHAVLFDARRAVLLRDQVHAVLQRGDQRNARRPVEGGEFQRVEAAEQVVDRHPVARRGELAVDAADQLFDLHAQIVVARDGLAARHHDLDQRDLVPEVRIAFERAAKCLQAVRDALRVIEAVDAEDELAIGQQLLQFVHPRGDGLAGCRADHAGVVDADREMADAQFALADPHLHHLAAARHRHVRQQCVQALQEVAPVAPGLETDQVVVGQRAHDRAAPRQLQEQVHRRKRDVQEKSHAPRVAAAAQLGADVHQLVVVDPDEIRFIRVLEHGFRKAPVHLQVGLPVGRREVAQRRQIVEQRPDHFVREAVVEVLDLVRAERDGVQRELAIVRAIERLLQGFVVAADSRPADPGPAQVAEHRQHGGDQPAAARRRAVVAVGIPLNHIRQAVRDDHRPVCDRSHVFHSSRHVSTRRAAAPAAAGRVQVSRFVSADGARRPRSEAARVSHPAAMWPVGQRL